MADLSKFVHPGDRVDIVPLQQAGASEGTKRQYTTRVYDVISDDEVQVNMPIEAGRIVVLSVGAEFDMCFYTNQGGLYQCYARVENRYKSNNVIIADMELTSNLRRFQRREYYRLNCTLDMKCTRITEDQTQQYFDNIEFIDTDMVMSSGTIVDLSGGGIRFISSENHEKGDNLYFSFKLNIGPEGTVFKTIGRIINCSPIEKKPGQYECRVQFMGIKPDERENIIKYIFEEERKNRQKSR